MIGNHLCRSKRCGWKRHSPILVGLLSVVLCAMVLCATGCTNAPESSTSASTEAAATSTEATAKKKVKVPDLQYFDKEEAEELLKESGLKLGKVSEKKTTEIPEGFILEQKPEADKEADEGSAIDVVLSKGMTKTTVPDITGMTAEEAEEAFYKAWIIPVPGEPVHSDATDPGLVCAQSVQGGQEVDVLKKVVYATSLGKEMVKVPDVSTRSVNDARDDLRKAGLGCDTTNSYSDNVPKDGIISQSIDAGDEVAKGTIVRLEVSLGKKPVEKIRIPNVLTYSLEDAKRALESAGLGYSYDADGSGTVVGTSPNVGTEVDPGTVVDLILQRPQEVTNVIIIQSDNGQVTEQTIEDSVEPQAQDDITLSESDARQVIWEHGLGDDTTAQKVQTPDGRTVWEIVANDTEGRPHTYWIDQNRNVEPV